MRISGRPLRRWLCIIGALFAVLVLGACSASRLAYRHAPMLLYYRLDAYLDMDGPQSLAFKESLNALQAWHRKEELPLLADWLHSLQALANQEQTPAQVCALRERVQQRLQAPLNQISPALGSLVSTLKPAQIQHLETEFRKRNAQWREEWLDLPPPERLQRRSTQVAERMEMFYGTLDDAQRAHIRGALEAAGYNPALQHQEMLRRQQDGLRTLAQVRGAAPVEVQAALQALFSRALASPDAATRQYFDAMEHALCTAAAAVHNSSSPSQKAHLRKTLQAYEADARALMQDL